jgi:hypothetical protein
MVYCSTIQRVLLVALILHEFVLLITWIKALPLIVESLR